MQYSTFSPWRPGDIVLEADELLTLPLDGVLGVESAVDLVDRAIESLGGDCSLEAPDKRLVPWMPGRFVLKSTDLSEQERRRVGRASPVQMLIASGRMTGLIIGSLLAGAGQ